MQDLKKEQQRLAKAAALFKHCLELAVVVLVQSESLDFVIMLRYFLAHVQTIRRDSLLLLCSATVNFVKQKIQLSDVSK